MYSLFEAVKPTRGFRVSDIRGLWILLCALCVCAFALCVGHIIIWRECKMSGLM